MWKLLRNLLLSAGVLALGLKLALWLAAGQQAQWLADRLQRWGELSWTGASGSFDGDLTLSGVQFRPKAGFEAATLNAASLRLRTPGLFWVLRRAVTRDAGVPEQLGVYLQDVNLPLIRTIAGGNAPLWFGAQTLVPFETFACGGTAGLDAADFTSMQVQPKAPRLSVDYRYDAAAQQLEVDLRIDNAPFAQVGLRTELRQFSPQMLDDDAARERVRIASADFNFRDRDFLRRRNQFCARETGVDVDGFIDRHIAAVQERLKASHIVPAEGVVEIYRELLRGGGEFKLLSLPREDIAPAQYDTYDPEEVLRWLNLTARHNDAPPVLFKLFFLAEPVEALAGIDRALVHDPLAEPEPETVVVRPEENPVLATTIGTSTKPQDAAPPLTSAPPIAPMASAAPPVAPAQVRTGDVVPESLAPRAAPISDDTAAVTSGSVIPARPPAPRIDPRLDPRLAGLPSAQIGWVGPVPFYSANSGARIERVFFLYRRQLEGL